MLDSLLKRRPVKRSGPPWGIVSRIDARCTTSWLPSILQSVREMMYQSLLPVASFQCLVLYEDLLEISSTSRCIALTMSSPVVSPQFRPEWMNLLIPVCRRERYPSRHKLNKSLKPVHEQRIVLSLRPGQGQAPKAQLLQQGAKQLVKAVETFRSFGWARDSLSENLYTKALAKYFVIGVQYLVRNWLRPACDDLVESNR